VNISTAILARKYQLGQYFARKPIIAHYLPGCNEERYDTKNLSLGPPPEAP
jgi:hypothetical protein